MINENKISNISKNDKQAIFNLENENLNEIIIMDQLKQKEIRMKQNQIKKKPKLQHQITFIKNKEAMNRQVKEVEEFKYQEKLEERKKEEEKEKQRLEQQLKIAAEQIDESSKVIEKMIQKHEFRQKILNEKQVDFKQIENVHKHLSVVGILGNDRDVFYDSIEDEITEQVNQDKKQIIDEGPIEITSEDVEGIEKYISSIIVRTNKNEQESSLINNEKKKISNFLNQQWKKQNQEKNLASNIGEKFGFNKMNQNFQKSLINNQKIIFNEMTKEERIEYERQKQERKQQILDFKNQNTQNNREKIKSQDLICLDELNDQNNNDRSQPEFQESKIDDQILIKRNKIQKKTLNQLEIDYANQEEIDLDLLSSENLKINTIAQAKLLKKIENFDKNKNYINLKNQMIIDEDKHQKTRFLENYKQIYRKQKSSLNERKIAFQDYLNNDLLIEE